MIGKNQVWSTVSSLSVKKVQNELWTNKQLSLKWQVSWAIQNGEKFCHSNLSLSMSKTEKNPKDEVEWIHNYLNRNICYIGKIHLVKNPKPAGFSLLWKLAKCPPSCPSPLPFGSNQSTKAG